MPDRVDPARLRSALDRVPDVAWSLPSQYRHTKVHHGYRRVPLISAGYRHAEADLFGWVLDAFAPVVDAWLSALEPGGFIVPHRDGGPWWQRWHIPVRTAGRIEAGAWFTPLDGAVFQIAHWEPHALMNDTPRRRVHLVIDRKVRVQVDRPSGESQEFQVLPVPSEFEALVRGAVDAANP